MRAEQRWVVAGRTDPRPSIAPPSTPLPSPVGSGVGFRHDWLLLIEWRLIWQQEAATAVEQIKTY